jgi:hypothetical protein
VETTLLGTLANIGLKSNRFFCLFLHGSIPSENTPKKFYGKLNPNIHKNIKVFLSFIVPYAVSVPEKLSDVVPE